MDEYVKRDVYLNRLGITNTLASVRKIKISDDTVAKYISYLEEATSRLRC